VYNDAAQALDAARDFKPDVAFIDLNMPGMTGIEFATQLKAEAWASAIELVALTEWDRRRISKQPAGPASTSISPSPRRRRASWRSLRAVSRAGSIAQ
jgi:CheY-like chemotaxis protein